MTSRSTSPSTSYPCISTILCGKLCLCRVEQDEHDVQHMTSRSTSPSTSYPCISTILCGKLCLCRVEQDEHDDCCGHDCCGDDCLSWARLNRRQSRRQRRPSWHHPCTCGG